MGPAEVGMGPAEVGIGSTEELTPTYPEGPEGPDSFKLESEKDLLHEPGVTDTIGIEPTMVTDQLTAQPIESLSEDTSEIPIHEEEVEASVAEEVEVEEESKEDKARKEAESYELYNKCKKTQQRYKMNDTVYAKEVNNGLIDDCEKKLKIDVFASSTTPEEI